MQIVLSAKRALKKNLIPLKNGFQDGPKKALLSRYTRTKVLGVAK